MTTKVVIAGFGGQGIILAGVLLAHAAMIEGKKVTHFPSYGAEMRGGTCKCYVVISDELISSPVITNPDIALVLNQPSKNKFEPLCKEKGQILINNSLVSDKIIRKDLDPFYVDASNIANKLGNIRTTNMVMIGALSKTTGIVKLDTLKSSLSAVVSGRNKNLIEINKKALEEGYNLS